ncbi:MAG: GAF domain-containing protein [Thermoplasmatota archaeon]
MELLHVDDEYHILEQSKLFLEKQNDEIEVYTATSVEEALDMLEKKNFDAIVSDYQMPGIDGLEFLKRLRGNGSNIPFIIFTRRDRKEVAIRALNLGANRYLNKGGDPKSQYSILSEAIIQEIKYSKAQQRLVENEEKFRTFTEAVPVAVMIYQGDEWTYVNKAAEEITGYDEEELLKMKFWEFVHPDYKDLIKKRGKARLNGENPISNYEFKILTKEGEERWVDLRAKPIKLDGETAVLISAVDITERKETDEALKLSVETYHGLFENSQDAIYIQKRDCSFIDINKAAEEMYGYSKEELIGKTPDKLSAPGKNDLDEIREKVWKAFDGEPQRFEFWGQKKNGEIFPKDVKLSKGKYFRDEVIFAFSREITELKETELKLERSKKKIKQLHEVAADLQGVKTRKDIYKIGIETAEEILEFEVCYIDIVEGNKIITKANSRGVYGKEIKVAELDDDGVDTRTYQNKRSYVIEDIREKNYPRRYRDYIRSVLSVPIGNIGVFQAVSGEIGYFDNEDKELAELLMSHIAEALNRVDKEKEIEENKKKIEELHDIANKLERSEDEEEVYEMIIDAAKKILGFEICSINIADENYLKIKATSYDEIPEENIMSIDEGLVGKTYQDKESYIINDVDDYDFTKPTEDRFNSCISIPILDIGVFLGISEDKDKFDERDLEMAELLISHASEALKRIQYEKELKESKRTYESIYNTTLSISKEKDLDKVIKIIADEAKGLLEAADCTVYLAYPEEEILKPIYTNDPEYFEELMAYDIKYGEGVAGNVVLTGDAEYINEEKAESETKTIPGTEDDEPESTLAVPMFDDEDVIGILSIGKKGERFDETHVKKIKTFARQAEMAIKRASDIERLHEMTKDLLRSKIKIQKLIEYIAKLESCNEEEEIIKIAGEAAEKILDFDICSIDKVDNDRFVLKYVSSRAPEGGAKERELEEGGLGAMTYRNQQSYSVGDLQDFKEAKPIKDEYRSAISVPIGDYGVFQAVSNQTEYFSEEDLQLAELLMLNVSEAIQRTEVYNREEFLLTLLRHDLKNKNQIIQGYLQLIDDEDLSEENKELLEKASMVNREGQKLLNKVGMLKEIDREEEITEVSLDKYIEKSLENYRNKAQEKGMKIDYEEEEITVLAGPLLEEMFNNILENSINHSEGDMIRINIEEYEDEVTIHIEDDGKGIEEDMVDKLFDRGFKDKNSSGLGIGMYLVKRIVDTYEGRIKIMESELGGARFDIIFNK